MLRFVRAGIYVIVRCGAAVFIDEIYIHIKQTKEDFMTKSNKGAAALIIAASLSGRNNGSGSYAVKIVFCRRRTEWENDRVGQHRRRTLAVSCNGNPVKSDAVGS